MKALVLAGGTGTRLRPLTHSMPKQLIPIANKAVLVHALENIKNAGVTEVGVIVSEPDGQISQAIGDGSDLGLRVTYIHQERPLGLAHCVQVAAGFLADDDFLMFLGDNMLVDGVADLADRFRVRRPDAQVVVIKVADPRALGVVELDTEGRVTRLVEKPQQPRSDLALTGVYFFTARIHEAIRAIRPSARGELEITDAIQWQLEHGHRVEAEQYHGYWRDTGCVNDVLDCNREVLDRISTAVHGEVDRDSVIEGAVLIEPGARVVASQLVGPLVIGMDSVVRSSRVGPHTSVGRNCELDGADVEHSVILDQVTVRGVRGIHGSLIGRKADVCTADPGVPRHRLVVGDHTSIEVTAP